MPSAAGTAAFAAAGIFVGTGVGVTRSSGSASAAVTFAVTVVDAASAFVAVMVGVGVPNHSGGYVPPPPPPVGIEPTIPKVPPVSVCLTCTLSLTQYAESVPAPDAFHAHTEMFAHTPEPTVVFMDVFVVPLYHLSFKLTLYESVTLPMSKTASVELSPSSGRPLAITLSPCHAEPVQL